jgi:hypothetical protein
VLSATVASMDSAQKIEEVFLAPVGAVIYSRIAAIVGTAAPILDALGFETVYRSRMYTLVDSRAAVVCFP